MSEQKRQHRATYAKDKYHGGYLVRVEGPHSNRFIGREVPVTKKDGSESTEKLTEIVWSGKDEESGKPVTLYRMDQKPIDSDDINF